jgi:prepilin-type N-terminal cleavage/methylation domain-containing protein
MPTSSVGVINRREGGRVRTGRKPGQTALSTGGENGSVFAGSAAPWDRVVSPGFRGLRRARGQTALSTGGEIGSVFAGSAAPWDRVVSPGFRGLRRGITLIEMLIVMALIALVAGMAAPSVAAGLDSLRLRSTSDAIIGFLNTALARADSRQQAVEILISQQDGTITAISGDHGFNKRLDIVSPIKILSVQPELAADAEDQNQPRRFLVYPGGAVPRIAIEIGNSRGRKRLVSIDPVTGVPQANAQ